MATINLGAIKFNWKGAYNSGTSYAVDDVVSSGGNSYVCIQAHTTAQAVGNATAYWNIMSSAGTNGTDGTDISTTLTAQGDMLYRDGSGLQRLAKGTASQELRMNSGATAPEWHTPAVASSDFVKIDSGSFSSVSYIDLDGTSKWGTAGTYARHKLIIYNATLTANANIFGRQLESGNTQTASIYSSANLQRNSANQSSTAGNAVDAGSNMQFTHDNLRGTASSANSHSLEFEIGGMHKVGSSSDSNQLQLLYRSAGSNQDGNTRLISNWASGISPQNSSSNTDRSGLKIYPSSGNWSGNYVIYGYKV